jgi:hypothetical protein
MHPLLLRERDPNDPAEKTASEEKTGILGMEKEDNPKENAGGMTDLEDGKGETKERTLVATGRTEVATGRTEVATGRTEVATGRTGVQLGMREIRIKREDPDRETEKTKAKETLKGIPVIVVLTRSQNAKKRQRRKASEDSFPSFSASKPLLGS